MSGEEAHTFVSLLQSKGGVEYTRKLTATETTELEHKAKTAEQMIPASQKPAVPPVFTKKIQPVRCYEKEKAQFECEFDGTPIPQIQWYREDFPIKNSPDFQVTHFRQKMKLSRPFR